MAIAFGTTTATDFVAATSYTQSAVSVSGANTYALVMVGLRTNIGDITGVTFNTVAMTELSQWNNSDGTQTIWLFGLAGPTTGDVVVTGDTSLAAGVITSIYTGVAQTSSTGTIATDKSAVGVPTDNSSVTVTSATDELVVDCVGWNSGGEATAGTGQTKRAETGNASMDIASSDEAGAASVAMTWTFTSSRWAGVGVPLKPFVAAAAANHWLLMGV